MAGGPHPTCPDLTVFSGVAASGTPSSRASQNRWGPRKGDAETRGNLIIAAPMGAKRNVAGRCELPAIFCQPQFPKAFLRHGFNPLFIFFPFF